MRQTHSDLIPFLWPALDISSYFWSFEWVLEKQYKREAERWNSERGAVEEEMNQAIHLLENFDLVVR